MINTDYYYSTDDFYFEEENADIDAYVKAWDKLSANLTIAGCYTFHLFVEQQLYRYTSLEAVDRLSAFTIPAYVKTHLLKHFNAMEIKALFDIYRDDIKYLLGVRDYLDMIESEDYRKECLSAAYEKQLAYILKSIEEKENQDE